MTNDTVNSICIDRREIVTRNYCIVEQTRLLAFWGRSLDQQLGRFVSTTHIGRDLGNNRIVQTPIVSVVLHD